LTHTCCFAIPPHIFEHIAKKGTKEDKDWAFNTIEISEETRGRRQALGYMSSLVGSVGTKQRTVYDAKRLRQLPGDIVMREGDRRDPSVFAREAYKYSGVTYDFFKKIFDRNSIDDQGLKLDSTVNYGRKYVNAFWDGRQMVYGNGDGKLFRRFTRAIDIVAHELTHGITDYEADLVYQDLPGALNEHMSDVFGSLVRQYHKKQKVDKADWLIGKGLFTTKVNGEAIRSMKAPGTAYDDPRVGRDPQPSHMRDYRPISHDHGGVHIYSGIANHAFYLAAMDIGGNAWEKTGKIWYITLRDKLRPNSDFKDAAKKTSDVATDLYGNGSSEQQAVKRAWNAVGVRP
jgi:Zn-dependent metalloprotease